MNRIEHWLVPDWPAPKNIYAATTLRSGGISTGVFASMNLAAHVGDEIEKVAENRRFIISALNLPREPVWLEQIHSDVVIDASNAKPQAQADASYSFEPEIVCAVMTADCLPLLVCDREGTRIAAIHAGWRGLLAGIISKTIKAMQTRNLMVWLGPAIGPSCFEVGSEVRDSFVNKSVDYLSAFLEQTNGQWLANIYTLAKIELAKADVNEIYGGNFCTFTDSARFYSYRRDNKTGRMASLIWRQ
jgi:polyphenol oxidase